MRQRHILRLGALMGVALAGGAAALVGAFAVGDLDGATTVEEFMPAPPSIGGGLTTASRDGAGVLSVAEIYRLDAPGVVEIGAPLARKQGGGGVAGAHVEPLGSGFVIDKAGDILTTSTVLGGRRRVMVSFSGDIALSARVLGVDDSTGIAVLQVDAHPRALSPLPLGDSDSVQVGDPVVAIGNPLSLTRIATAGIVSAVERGIDPTPTFPTGGRSIETDAAINSGNAGGPLIDQQGEVIGINTELTIARSTGAVVGLGFAIPINVVKSVIAALIHDRVVEHAYLGVEAVPLTRTLAREFNLPVTAGLLVQTVTRPSGASEAGLEAGTTPVILAGESYRIGGDIIVAADGIPVVTVAELRDVIEALAPGDAVRLSLWRAGKPRTLKVTLGESPS